MNGSPRTMSFVLCLFVACLPAWAQVTLPFTDNFTGPTLNPAWQVLPGNGTYSVGGGQLRYYNVGPVSSTTGWFNNALTLALPFTGTNWKLDIKATYSLAWCLSGTYTGPPVYTGCSSGTQGPMVLAKFAPGSIPSGSGGVNYAGNDWVRITRAVDAWYSANQADAAYCAYGTCASSGNFLDPADSMIQNNIAGGTYWYQIIRNAGTITIKYSRDGIAYTTAFSTSLFNPSSLYNELLIGGITYLSAGSFTDYGPVTITSLDTPATTQTTVSASANPALLGQTVTFTAAVVAVPASAGTPSGTVQFLVDGSPIGAPVALANGMASVSVATLSLGSHSITAQYGGDTSFPGSSGALNQRVDYGFLGLQSPYAPPASRTFKIPSAVPLVWQYTDYLGAVLNSAAAAPVVNIVNFPCEGTGGTVITLNDAGNSGYQYSSLTNSWQFNWKTTGLVAGCYNISISSAQTGQTNGFFPIQLR